MAIPPRGCIPPYMRASVENYYASTESQEPLGSQRGSNEKANEIEAMRHARSLPAEPAARAPLSSKVRELQQNASVQSVRVTLPAGVRLEIRFNDKTECEINEAAQEKEAFICITMKSKGVSRDVAEAEYDFFS